MKILGFLISLYTVSYCEYYIQNYYNEHFIMPKDDD